MRLVGCSIKQSRVYSLTTENIEEEDAEDISISIYTKKEEEGEEFLSSINLDREVGRKMKKRLRKEIEDFLLSNNIIYFLGNLGKL